MSNVTLSNLVDQYADLHAQVADLTEKAEKIKAQLVESGEARIKGTFVKAAISVSAARRTVDWKGVAEQLNPSPDLVAACTKVGKPSASIRLYGL